MAKEELLRMRNIDRQAYIQYSGDIYKQTQQVQTGTRTH
jgi:hypothetical protein